MIAAFILAVMLAGALVVAGAEVLHRTLVAWQRPSRWVWVAAIAVMLVLTARLALSTPHRASAAAADAAPSWLADAARTHPGPHVSDSGPLGAAGRRLRVALGTVAAAVPPRVQGAVSLVVALLPAAMLLLLAAGYLRVRHAKRSWRHSTLDATPVRLSRNAGPAVVGLAPMEIVVPEWIVARDAHEQAMILRHEREHILARDPWTLIAACIGVAMTPWNAAMWFALARLRLAIELDCDRRVLSHSVPPLDYGRVLLDISERAMLARTRLPALGYGSHGTSHLETRIRTMSQQVHRWAGVRSASAALVALAAVLSACEAKLPTAAEVEAMDAKSAVAMVDSASHDSGKLIYLVDAYAVTSDSATRISASRIASISIRNARESGRIVDITTRGAKEPMRVTLVPSTRAGEDSAATQRALAEAEGGLVASRATAPAEQAGTPRLVRLCATGGSEQCRDATIDAVPSMRGADTVPARSAAAARDQALVLAARTSAGEPAYVIDGVVVDASRLKTLDPNRIDAIEVVKGSAAKERYAVPNAENGVIVITTKRR